MSFSQLLLGPLTVSKLQKALVKDDIKTLENILQKAFDKKWDMKKLMLTPTFSGAPLLFFAPNAKAAHILLCYGAEPTKEYKWGEGTTNWFKANYHRPDLLAQSILHGAYLNLENMKEIERQYFSRDEYLPVFKALLATSSPERPFNINANYENTQTRTYLMGAALSNAVELGSWLLDNGAKLRAFKKLDSFKDSQQSKAVIQLQISLDLLIQESEITIAVNEGHHEFLEIIYKKFSAPENLAHFKYILENAHLNTQEKKIALERLYPLAEKHRLETLLPSGNLIHEKSAQEIRGDSIPKAMRKRTHKI